MVAHLEVGQRRQRLVVVGSLRRQRADRTRVRFRALGRGCGARVCDARPTDARPAGAVTIDDAGRCVGTGVTCHTTAVNIAFAAVLEFVRAMPKWALVFALGAGEVGRARGSTGDGLGGDGLRLVGAGVEARANSLVAGDRRLRAGDAPHARHQHPEEEGLHFGGGGGALGRWAGTQSAVFVGSGV